MVEVAYFLAGVILTIALSPPGLAAAARFQKRIGWRAFTKAMRRVITKLEQDDWTPDVVVGLNSGIVAAAIVALNLRVPTVLFYDCLPGYEAGQREAKDILDKQQRLAGKRVLVIDDQGYTGGSMDRLYRHLIEEAHADPALIKRHILFTHKSGAGRLEKLEIPTTARVRGKVKKVPWVISESIKHFWKDREDHAA